VWCGVSPCGLIGTSLCDGIVTGLFSHWWWSLRTHAMALSLSTQEM
jgi:hypothetical protein